MLLGGSEAADVGGPKHTDGLRVPENLVKGGRSSAVPKMYSGQCICLLSDRDCVEECFILAGR